MITQTLKEFRNGTKRPAREWEVVQPPESKMLDFMELQ